MLDRGHRLSPREAGTARDSVAKPGASGDGAGCFPRWTDYQFLVWFLATINFHPFLVRSPWAEGGVVREEEKRDA